MAGYYEWIVNAVDIKQDPWFIHAEHPFWAAGLWEDHSPLLAEGNRGTFTVITGNGSGISADIHDRMPVPPAAEHFADWRRADQDDVMALLTASTPPSMQPYRVSRRVNTPPNNDPSLFSFETGSQTGVIAVAAPLKAPQLGGEWRCKIASSSITQPSAGPAASLIGSARPANASQNSPSSCTHPSVRATAASGSARCCSNLERERARNPWIRCS